MDDAPTQRFAAVTPPPRPSQRPDTRNLVVDTLPDASPRARNITVLALVAAALIAALIGYTLIGHGPTPVAAGVTLGNYANMPDTAAQETLANAGFTVKLVRTSSDTVPANRVIRQNPGAGTKLPRGSVVELFVSNGLPTIGLRDVRGYTLGDATKDLQSDKMTVRVERRFDVTAKDTVIEERPAPGTHVRQASAVTLVVSDGPAPVKLPNLAGLRLDDARKVAARLGFTINIAETAPSDKFPANTIASQDPPTGSTIAADHSAVVNVVVSSGGTATNVPDVTGLDPTTAQHRLQDAGFTSVLEYSVRPGSSDNGKIVDESPSANTPAQRGTSVHLSLSVPGEVPDTEGETLDDARRALIAAGYQIGNVTPTTDGADGKVVRTEPAVGTTLRPGESVNIFVNNASGTPQQQ